MKKKVLVFGSTGSVGRNALEVIKKHQDKFEVVGLCSNRNINELSKQISQFRPKYVCLKGHQLTEKLKEKTEEKYKLFRGTEGLEQFSKIESDISIMAISGIDCLGPLLTNICHAKRIALANKEAIITAAKFIFAKAKKYHTEIIPVDSEINAIFQLFSLTNFKKEEIGKVYITASGGSLLDYNRDSLDKVTAEEVLNHPTWDMGKRITIDSATLVNKGFEVIEAHEFFNLDYEKIEVLLHRQSLIHAMIKLRDQISFSCVYPPDMKQPISFSLFYPERVPLPSLGTGKDNFDFSYRPILYKKFPLLEMVLEAAKRKDNALVVLNACDEIVVGHFIDKKIKFTQIERIMSKIFKIYPSSELKTIEDIYYWDKWARNETKKMLGEK